jgi:hypothetical protein
MQKQSTQLSEKNLKILVPKSNGVSFDKAFQLAKGKKDIIISNKKADKVLVETEIWKSFKEAFPIWTGTMTAYTEANKRIGSVVEYEDPNSKKIWTWEVPAGYRKEKNIILVAEHPDYDLVEEKNRIIVNTKNKIIVVENFPTRDGWYKTDENTAIPVNVPINSDSKEARYLYRLQERVGPLVRGDDDFFSYDNERDVDADDRPSLGLGVLVASETGCEAAAEKSEQKREILKTLKSLSDQIKELTEKVNKL